MSSNNIINEHEADDKNSSDFLRIPFWLDDHCQPVFCWLHIPTNREISATGIAICNPLGYEYSHTHRTIRHLSDHLASQGHATIRFDYHGTGDSSSDLFAPKRIETFLQNIDSVINCLKKHTGVNNICLIGLRFGASLAAHFCSKTSIDKLILWSCYTKGRTYIRETKALEKLASHSKDTDKNFIDSGGFIVTSETEKALSQINLFKQPFLVNEKILIIERDDMQVSDKLLHLIQEKNINVEKYQMSGYLDMMAEPHETKIPFATLSTISRWISENESPEKQTITEKQEHWFKQLTSIKQGSILEEICLQQDSNLMGILSSPDIEQHHKLNKPLIILANSGSVHRVGPNRVYVKLARAAAAAGFSVLRFDLSNLGDSVVGNPSNENHPYPVHSTQDIATTITYMKKHFGYQNFVIAGLCSGAYSVFHAGLRLPLSNNIKEVIMINLLTIYRPLDTAGIPTLSYQVEKDTQHYQQSVFSAKKWKKLFSGKVDLLNLTSFAVQKLFKTVSLQLGLIGEVMGLQGSSRLAQDLKNYTERGIKINFFISSKDPGKRILMSHAKSFFNKQSNPDTLNITDIPDSDHTFSEHSCRQLFVELFVAHIHKNYAKGNESNNKVVR
jgi:pimeloyl-ACP methyl ester carboxylesterase